MKTASTFHVPVLIISLFFAFSALAQEVEDVVYLKNGSIIRGIITEMVPNEQLKIQTRNGNLLVFSMGEVEKVAKEPLTKPKTLETPVSKPEEPFHIFAPLEPNRSGYTALLGGVHTATGDANPFIGLIGVYDTKIDFPSLSGTNAYYSTGFMGILEWSPSAFWAVPDIGIDGDIFCISALGCVGVESKYSAYRLGIGGSYASVDFDSPLEDWGISSLLPTAIVSATFYPLRQNLEHYREHVAVTFYARWQGQGAMVGVSMGLLQRGPGR